MEVDNQKKIHLKKLVSEYFRAAFKALQILEE